MLISAQLMVMAGMHNGTPTSKQDVVEVVGNLEKQKEGPYPGAHIHLK